MTAYLSLNAVLAASFPRDCTIAKIRAVYEDSVHSPEKPLGIEVKLVDGESTVSYPMATVIWHKRCSTP